MTAPQAELFELPAELAIDTDVARRVIAQFIRGQLRQAGFERLVLGLSGGIDSALVAYLSAEAIGAERLLCVLMPYRTSSEASLVDAESVVDALGCASEVVEISPMVDAYFAADPDATPLRRGNFMARQRMAVLYDRSVTWGGLVVGTGNKTESLIGYTTLFGDSACAFNPIGDLYKSQVRQVSLDDRRARGDHPQGAVGRPLAGPDRRGRGRLQLPGPRPAAVLADRQAPLGRRGRRAGLRPGARRAGRPDGRRRRSSSARCRRSRSSGRGRPASTTSIRGGGPARRAGERASGRRSRRRAPVRRRDADREPRRRHAAGARGAAVGAADRGRGHPAHPAAARAQRDRDADDQLPRPERAGPVRAAARPPPGRRGPRARHRRRARRS